MNPSPILKPINTFLIVAICIYGFTSCGQVSTPPPEKKVVKKESGSEERQCGETKLQR